MKAIVVELKNDFAAVLSDDGCITTVKNNNYEVGQTIQLSKAGTHLYQLHKKICVLAASAAAATVILATGTWAYASPYYYVSLDVNPSIEYTVNRFDRVLRIKAMNDDGEELLNGTDFVNKSISTAFSSTIEQLAEAGYLKDEAGNGIVIATSSENKEKAEELAADLREIAVKHINEDGNHTEVEAFSVDTALMDKAKELGVTPGKLNLVEKLKDVASSSDSVNMEEWLDKSVNEIKKATKTYQASEEKGQSANDTDTYSEDANPTSDTTVEEYNTSKNHNANDSRADNNNTGGSDKKVSSHKQETAKKNENSVKKHEDAPDNTDEHNDRASQVDKKYSDNSIASSNNSSSSNIEDSSTSDKKDKIIDNGDDPAQEITEIPATVTCEPPMDSDPTEGDHIDEAGGKSKDLKETELKDNNSQSEDAGNGNGASEKSDHKSSE